MEIAAKCARRDESAENVPSVPVVPFFLYRSEDLNSALNGA